MLLDPETIIILLALHQSLQYLQEHQATVSMATMMGYPPFSAPATLERRNRKWSSWFSNAREAFMRPWRQRHWPRRGRGRANPRQMQGVPQGPNSLTSFEGYSGQGFPDFSSRLSPLGGRPQSKGKKQDFVDGTAQAEDNSEKKSLVKIPENPAPSRPPLSNIFPMLNNNFEVSPPAHMGASSIKKAMEQRRHSTPVTPHLLLVAPTPVERRASASSDTSADKPRQGRRERRASVTRELPLLPKRGEDPFHPKTPPSNPTLPSHSEYKGPQISPYSEYNGPINSSRPNQITMNFGPVRHPPVGAPSAFTYPPMWPQPHHQLQELEEELEEDGEGDGEEEGVVIDEEWKDFKVADHTDSSSSTPASEVELNVTPDTHMGLSGLPPSHIGPGAYETTSPGEPAQKGALGKILRLVSSSKRKPDGPKPAMVGNLPKGDILAEEDDNTDIKGFDNFFMY